MRQTKAKTMKRYYILYIAPLILSLFILSNNTFTNTSALEYQNNTNIQFTLNPTISISISDNLAIDNLSPGTAKDSNVINVNVATNNVTGYTLSATVGNSTTNPNNELTHTTTPTYKFTSTSTDITELTNLESDTWGYNYSTNNGATWHDYSTLPLYTDAGTTLNYKNNASNDNIKFKIGAKASSTQPAGTYTNTINFYATANQSPVTFTEAFALAGKTQHNGYYTMQDMSHSICEAVDIDTNIQLIDIRDNEVYMISKLKDGNCWMLDNLRLDPTDSTTAANMSASNTNAPATTITNYLNGSSTAPQEGWSTTAVIVAASDSWSNTYTVPRVNTSFADNTKDSIVAHFGNSNGKRGVYYNYCAATVSTYCYASNDGKDTSGTLIDAPYDICPTGWRMPTGGNSGEYQNLCTILNKSNCDNGITMAGNDVNSLQYQLSLALSGFLNGNLQSSYGSGGGYLSSTITTSKSGMYYLFANTDSIWATSSSNRDIGYSVRCLAK